MVSWVLVLVSSNTTSPILVLNNKLWNKHEILNFCMKWLPINIADLLLVLGELNDKQVFSKRDFARVLLCFCLQERLLCFASKELRHCASATLTTQLYCFRGTSSETQQIFKKLNIRKHTSIMGCTIWDFLLFPEWKLWGRAGCPPLPWTPWCSPTQTCLLQPKALVSR